MSDLFIPNYNNVDQRLIMQKRAQQKLQHCVTFPQANTILNYHQTKLARKYPPKAHSKPYHSEKLCW